jgi:hypothetical protein
MIVYFIQFVWVRLKALTVSPDIQSLKYRSPLSTHSSLFVSFLTQFRSVRRVDRTFALLSRSFQHSFVHCTHFVFRYITHSRDLLYTQLFPSPPRLPSLSAGSPFSTVRNSPAPSHPTTIMTPILTMALSALLLVNRAGAIDPIIVKVRLHPMIPQHVSSFPTHHPNRARNSSTKTAPSSSSKASPTRKTPTA